MRKVAFTFLISKDLHKRLKKVSELTMMSMGSIIRMGTENQVRELEEWVSKNILEDKDETV